MPTSAEWLVFLGTATLFAVTPGPGILYVLARTLRGGRREGLQSVLGNSLGASAHVVAAALGLSALLATSTVAFTAVKFAGAAYLVYLGLHSILRRHDDGAPDLDGGALGKVARSPFAQGALSEVLNPKTALYFMALLPHFVHEGPVPAPLVFMLLGVIAVVMATGVDVVVAVFADKLGAKLTGNPRLRVRQRIASGAVMIGLGGYVAVAD